MSERNTNSSLIFDDDKKTITLICSEDLYKYLKEIQSQGFENLNPVNLIKIYGQIKKYL